MSGFILSSTDFEGWPVLSGLPHDHRYSCPAPPPTHALAEAASGWTPLDGESMWTHQAKGNLRAGLSRSLALDIYGSLDVSNKTHTQGIELYFYY